MNASQGSCLLHPNSSTITKEGLVFKTHSLGYDFLHLYTEGKTSSCGPSLLLTQEPVGISHPLCSALAPWCFFTASKQLLMTIPRHVGIFLDLNLDGSHSWLLIRKKNSPELKCEILVWIYLLSNCTTGVQIIPYTRLVGVVWFLHIQTLTCKFLMETNF